MSWLPHVTSIECIVYPVGFWKLDRYYLGDEAWQFVNAPIIPLHLI